MKSFKKSILLVLILGSILFLMVSASNIYADSKKSDVTSIDVNKLINKAKKDKLKNGLYETNVQFTNQANWSRKSKNSYVFITGTNHQQYKLYITKNQLKKIFDVTHAKLTITSKKTDSATKLSAKKIKVSNTVPDSKKNQTYSDVVIDDNKLNSLAEKLQNGSTGDFIDEYTAMTMPEQSKYYRALVDKDLTVTIKGSAFNIDSQGNKMMVYAGNDIPGTNITQPISAEDYFQDKQKEHKIFRVETEGSQFLTVDPMDDVTVTGKLDQVANLYQKDKMDGYFKLTDATLMSH
ncbi:hypothetical protein G9401_00210 [Weissella paramesenteroides]|uniref:hypothetical protein n=2 Tax=Lactobacillaceae TaxID=33958 RepID=UPI0023F93138|nr:hypothetical protein [Weissella paramesenteroides]MDF8374018.1 hypothetical protein [Weissella paramesenteroides]